MNIQFPGIFRPFLGKLTWNKKPSSKVIYLTFDDGPVPDVTPQLLDLLDIYNWKATFFCVGENVQKYPEIYNDIINRGHTIGNHSFNHINGFKTSTKDYVINIEKAAKLINSRLFRPPYGKITRKQINALKSKYEIVMWDVITYDYDNKLDAYKVFKIIEKNLKNGSIVVFHDSLKSKNNVLEVIPMAINFWTKNGYTFGTL